MFSNLNSAHIPCASYCQDEAAAVKTTVKIVGKKIEILSQILREIDDGDIRPTLAKERVMNDLRADMVRTSDIVAKARRMNYALYLLRAKSMREELEHCMRHMHFSLSALETTQQAMLQRDIEKLSRLWQKHDVEWCQEVEHERLAREKLQQCLSSGGRLSVQGLRDDVGITRSTELRQALKEASAEAESLRKTGEAAKASRDEVARAKAKIEEQAVEQLIAAINMCEVASSEEPAKDNLEPPEWCTCPISQEVMGDPIIVSAECNHTVDRASYENWIARGNTTCPVCRAELRSRKVSPNANLRDAIHATVDAKYFTDEPASFPVTLLPVSKSVEGRKPNLKEEDTRSTSYWHNNDRCIDPRDQISANDKYQYCNDDDKDGDDMLMHGYCDERDSHAHSYNIDKPGFYYSAQPYKERLVNNSGGQATDKKKASKWRRRKGKKKSSKLDIDCSIQ